jgi:hypothetical protein
VIGTAPKPHNMTKMSNSIVPTYKLEKHHEYTLKIVHCITENLILSCKVIADSAKVVSCLPCF